MKGLIPTLAVTVMLTAYSGSCSYRMWAAQAAPPGPPQNLTSIVIGNTVTLNWSAPTIGGLPAAYLLEAAFSPNGPTVATLTVVRTSIAIPDVPNGAFYVRTRAVNSAGQSAPSNEIPVVVPGGTGGGCTSPPNPPQALTGGVAGSLISVNWAPPLGGCPATNFTLAAGSGPGLSNIAVLTVGPHTGLSGSGPPGTYYIRVTAQNAYGSSPPSNEITLIIAGTPPPPVSEWTVIQTFVSVTGPDNCWVREQRERLTGWVIPDLPMTVTRSGTAIRLGGDFFQVNYIGTISGSDFSATGELPLEGGGWPCRDGTSFIQLPGVSNLSGRFSADDQRLTATEVNSYRLTTGELVTYTWDWLATRRSPSP